MGLDSKKGDVAEEPPPFTFDHKCGWSERDGKRIYRGPIHTIKFPPEVSAFTEYDAWLDLGFYVTGRGADIRSGGIITVYNWIDPRFIEALRKSGVIIEIKEGELEI